MAKSATGGGKKNKMKGDKYGSKSGGMKRLNS